MNTEPNLAGTGGRTAKIIAGALLSACLVASLGLNIYQAAVPNRKSADFIDYVLERIAEEEKKENEYMEDGYRVAGVYEIRSTTHISDAYKNGGGQLSAEDQETLDMAKAVLDKIIEDGMSDYEKELAVYRWMVENIGGSASGVISRPGMDRSGFTPHSVLSSKGAVCVGYATTFRLFMNMLGLDCRVVHNDYHSWNLVKLDDGWYHVDVYSDAHRGLYDNFNMTDEIARNDHSWDESALPEAKDVKYTPAVQDAVELDSVLDVPAAVREALDGENATLFYKFRAPLTQEDMDTADLLVSVLTTVLNGGMLGEESYYLRAFWYPSDREGDYILGLLLENLQPDEETGSGLDSPEAQSIIRLVAEAFRVDPAILGGEIGDFPVDDAALG